MRKGSDGELITAYSELLKEMWQTDSTISDPSELKKVLD
jgi:hypothetical protein